jgi:hypothetical protein
MEEHPVIDITFQMTPKDMGRAVGAITRENLKRPRWIVSAAILELFVLLGYGVPLLRSEDGISADAIEKLVLYVLALPAILALTAFVVPRTSAKSIYAKNPHLKGPLHWIFSDQKLIQESVASKAEVFWKAYVKVRETGEFFLFYPQKNYAYVVPKSAFSGEAEIESLRAMIRRHVADVKLT